MTAATRWFVVAALAALLGTAGLHFLVLAGSVRLWPAATHLTIFGWVTAMILAVSYHTMPVFSTRDFPFPRLIAIHCGIFAAGVTLTTLMALALGLFAATVWPTLAAVRPRPSAIPITLQERPR